MSLSHIYHEHNKNNPTTHIYCNNLDVENDIVANGTVSGANPVFNQNLATKLYVDNAISGAGDVVGPASSINNSVARFDGVTGKILKSSGVTISDTDTITTTGDIVATGTVSGAEPLLSSHLTTKNYVDLATAGGGDVVGPSSSTALSIPVFDGTTGKLLMNSSTNAINRATLNEWGDFSVNTVKSGRIDAGGSQPIYISEGFTNIAKFGPSRFDFYRPIINYNTVITLSVNYSLIASSMAGLTLSYTGLSANRTVTCPTAGNLSDVYDTDGISFEFIIINIQQGNTYTVTLLTNTQIYLSGNMVVDPLTTGIFRAYRGTASAWHIIRVG